MGASRVKSQRCRNVALLLSLAALLHFAFSMLIWILLIHATVRLEGGVRLALPGALPAFLLLAWFVAALVTTLRSLRIAGWMLGRARRQRWTFRL